MADTTTPANIPSSRRASVKAACEKYGPILLGGRYPQEAGEPKANLTTAETGAVFEAVTRKFWRDLIATQEAEQAAEQARADAIASVGDDPFAETHPTA